MADIPDYTMAQLTLYLGAVERLDGLRRANLIVDTCMAMGGETSEIQKTVKVLRNG